MNVEQRIQYWNEYAKLQGKLERRFLPLINKVLRNQISSFTDRYEKTGVLLQSDLNRVNPNEMALALMSLHIYSAIVNATKVYKELKTQKFRGIGENDKWTRDVLKYLKDHNLKLLRNITSETRKRIVDLISKGVEKGWGADKIARLVRMDGITKGRALRIVRTETVRATNVGSLIAAQELGIEVKKQWIATRDERTRDTHKALDGKIVEMDARFENGCLLPGDPDAAAKETINCRCVLGFVPKTDTRGDTVPKIEIEETEQPIPDIMSDIMNGVFIGGMIGNWNIGEQMIKFVREIFKGVGLENELDIFLENN